MKRLFILCSMLSLLVGCSNFEEINQPVGGATEFDLPKEVSAVVSDSDDADDDTRTFVVRDQHVLWQTDDAISYFAGTMKAKYVYTGVSGVTTANFDLVEDSNISRILYTNAVYPYDADASCVHVGGVDQLSVNYPAEQNYAVDSFGKGANMMVAMGTTPGGYDKNLYFRNACGYFTIKLYSNKFDEVAIKSIKLTALGGEKIAGPATIIFNGSGIPETTMSNEGVSEVTLTCAGSGKVISSDIQNPTEFWFALPPTTFKGGLRVEITDVNGKTYIKETTKRIVVNRNKIQPMAAIKFAYPTDNQLWYTRHSDSQKLMEFYDGDNPFDANITDHYYDELNDIFVIEFDAPLTVIKEQAFESYGMTQNSADMASVYLPEKLTTIEEEAFYGTGITEFIVPGNVNYIGEDNFIVCRKLRSVIFHPSPTNTPLEMETNSSLGNDQGQFIYNGEVSLSYIYVDRDIHQTKGGELFTPDDDDEGIFACGAYAPAGTVVIGEQLPEIYPYMFSRCNIDNVEIPAHISKIGDGAFFGCNKLTTITIPKTVKSIGDDAFFNTTSLKTVIIEDSDEPLQLGLAYSFTGEDRGTFYYSPLSNIYLGRDIDYREEGEPFTPNYWDEGVFASDYYDLEELETTVTISNNVTTLSKWMFSGARMREVTIPASVKNIEDKVFYDCRILNTVTCKSTSPATLGTNVFDSCDVFEYIYVPSTAESAYKSAQGWSSYKSMIVGY